MLGIRASPKEESGTSVGEAALGHILTVQGQLLTTTVPPADTPVPPADTLVPPADTPVPPAVIPAAKRTYAEAATTHALDGATHAYVQSGGVGLPLADNYVGPYLVLEKGPKVFKL